MSFNFPVKVCLKEDIMCENMYYVSCLLLPILLTNQIVRGFDYMGGEESTVPPHNFFSEETSGDYYAPMQEQEAMFQDITSIQKISTDDLSYKLSTEEDLSLSNVYTTIMPDYFQMLPDRNNSEEVYNDGYGENVELSKNATETNQIMNSSGDYPDPFEMDTTTAAGSTMRSKQGKQIQIIKLLPKEALRNFIEDAFIRTPLAAVVDTSPNSLEKTKALWKDALRSNTALDIVLLAFNYSGVAVTYHFQNTRTFLAGLESLKEDSTGDAFYGIIKASELIPYDSAVFVSTAVVPRESSMTRIAAITLLKKRIRLYLIWFGETSLRENETQEITGGILGEVAIRSGGEILHANSASSFTDSDDNMLTLISDSYLGTKRMEALNDESVRVRLDGPIQTATLETPNGG